MAKLYYKVRDFIIVVLGIGLIIAFILLVILGYTQNPDKTWGPPNTEQRTESR